MDTIEQILVHDLTTALDILKDYSTDKHRLRTLLFNFRDFDNGCESYGCVELNFCLEDPYTAAINKMIKYHKNFRIHRIRGVYGAWNAYYVDVIREKRQWGLVPQDVAQSFGVPEKQII